MITNSISETARDLNKSIPKIDVDDLRKQDKDLYNKINRHINPITNTLTNDLDSIPIGVINELISKNHLDSLPTPSKNTIKSLLKSDLSRLSPTELPICEIPSLSTLLPSLSTLPCPIPSFCSQPISSVLSLHKSGRLPLPPHILSALQTTAATNLNYSIPRPTSA
mmetsp:Transcript_41119/g.47330  ORF Transcript_41119/g.47330 Transcript_41119/m.47330 type:complete len:166 (-) Transcript_41119:2141-2638(-)